MEDRIDALETSLMLLNERVGALQTYAEVMQGRQIGVLAVLSLLVKHHPNPQGLLADVPGAVERLANNLLFSPMPDHAGEAATATAMSLFLI